MRGVSRAALRAAHDELVAQQRAASESVRRATGGKTRGTTAAERADLGDQLFAVARVLDANATLRRAFSDPSRSAASKQQLAEALFGAKISAPALAVLQAAVKGRWSATRDLPDALDELAARADVAGADAAGDLDDVEDELFRLSRIVAADRELTEALQNRTIGVRVRQGLLTGLITRRATPVTVRLAARAVDGRGRNLADALQRYSEIAAAHRERRIATVRVAAELPAADRDRLSRALRAQYGQQIQLNVIVDPGVLGGMRVELGDELIDGTVASKLSDARRRIAG